MAGVRAALERPSPTQNLVGRGGRRTQSSSPAATRPDSQRARSTKESREDVPHHDFAHLPVHEANGRIVQRSASLGGGSCGCEGSGPCQCNQQEKSSHGARDVRSGVAQRCSCGSSTVEGRECAACGPAQRAGAPPQYQHDEHRFGGRPLEPAVRERFERALGHDFGGVRVHADGSAAASATNAGALAYTIGPDIVFGPRQYDPHTSTGAKLLAHELVHVVQQGAAPGIAGVAGTRVERSEPSTLRRTGWSECEAIGVPCPIVRLYRGSFCRFVDCYKARTSNLPFAISPGVCIHRCDDGKLCACVLVGTPVGAMCAFTFCDSPGQASAGMDTETLVARAEEGFRQSGGEQSGDASGMTPPTAQAKLRIGPAGDTFEQEADRLAERAVSTAAPAPAPLRLHGATGPQAQRESPRLDRELQLRPPPPPPLFPPGSVPEALVVPDIPAPPQLQLPPLLSPPQQPSLRSSLPPLTGPPPFTPMRIIPIPRCIPNRALTWADFPATRPDNSTFGAQTSLSQPLITVQGNEMFQLQLQANSSVKSKYRSPAIRASNACAPPIQQCRSWLTAHPGGTWNFTPPVPNPCPASILPISAAPATTASECDTVLGPACDTAAQAESTRLLAHEQGHFDIGCVLVNKANNALRAGTPSATVQPRLNAEQTARQAAYDTSTIHGCNAAAQAAAEADIAAGMPAVTIP